MLLDITISDTIATILQSTCTTYMMSGFQSYDYHPDHSYNNNNSYITAQICHQPREYTTVSDINGVYHPAETDYIQIEQINKPISRCSSIAPTRIRYLNQTENNSRHNITEHHIRQELTSTLPMTLMGFKLSNNQSYHIQNTMHYLGRIQQQHICTNTLELSLLDSTGTRLIDSRTKSIRYSLVTTSTEINMCKRRKNSNNRPCYVVKEVYIKDSIKQIIKTKLFKERSYKRSRVTRNGYLILSEPYNNIQICDDTIPASTHIDHTVAAGMLQMIAYDPITFSASNIVTQTIQDTGPLLKRELINLYNRCNITSDRKQEFISTISICKYSITEKLLDIIKAQNEINDNYWSRCLHSNALLSLCMQCNLTEPNMYFNGGITPITILKTSIYKEIQDIIENAGSHTDTITTKSKLSTNNMVTQTITSTLTTSRTSITLAKSDTTQTTDTLDTIKTIGTPLISKNAAIDRSTIQTISTPSSTTQVSSTTTPQVSSTTTQTSYSTTPSSTTKLTSSSVASHTTQQQTKTNNIHTTTADSIQTTMYTTLNNKHTTTKYNTRPSNIHATIEHTTRLAKSNTPQQCDTSNENILIAVTSIGAACLLLLWISILYSYMFISTIQRQLSVAEDTIYESQNITTQNENNSSINNEDIEASHPDILPAQNQLNQENNNQRFNKRRITYTIDRNNETENTTNSQTAPVLHRQTQNWTVSQSNSQQRNIH